MAIDCKKETFFPAWKISLERYLNINRVLYDNLRLIVNGGILGLIKLELELMKSSFILNHLAARNRLI